MSLISIRREIFVALTEELQKLYVEDTLSDAMHAANVELDKNEIDYIIKGICQVINSNEEFNNKYGKTQRNGFKLVEEGTMVPAGEEPSGYYYSSGKIVICPFDWTPEENGDFNYSFTLAKII